MKNVANYVAYYRVSTKKQGESGLGLEAQEKGITDFCGTFLIGSFVEVESGSKKNRVELNKAIQLCKETGATLIAFRLDRILRSLSILTALRENKVRFTALDCLNDNDMIISIKAAFAEEELKKISERTSNALKAKIARGDVLGIKGSENLVKGKASEKSVQTRKENAIESKENRQAMAMIELFKEKGLTMQEMANRLNELGYETSRKKSFTTSQVQMYLKRIK